MLTSDKSSKGAYEEVIPTSSQTLSKLDLEISKLVLRTLFVHITPRIHQNSDRIFKYFGPSVYANAFLRIHRYALYSNKLIRAPRA